MKLTEELLFLTEKVLIQKPANLWIRPSEHQLSKFAFNQFLGNNEALGGSAFLTNYRVVFQSHSLNRLVGVRSILLPNVVNIKKGLISVNVESRVQTFKFVMWFNKGFVTTAQSCIDQLDEDQIDRLRQVVQAHPERMGKPQKHETFEAINKVLSGAMKIGEAVAKLAAPDKGAFGELLALFANKK